MHAAKQRTKELKVPQLCCYSQGRCCRVKIIQSARPSEQQRSRRKVQTALKEAVVRLLRKRGTLSSYVRAPPHPQPVPCVSRARLPQCLKQDTAAMNCTCCPTPWLHCSSMTRKTVNRLCPALSKTLARRWMICSMGSRTALCRCLPQSWT